jgi:hypothetical protein
MPTHVSPFLRIAPAASLFALVLVYALLMDGVTECTPFPAGEDTAGPDRIVVAFRNDDLTVKSAPSTEDSVIQVFRRRAIRQTFAFIPHPEGYIRTGSSAEASRTMIDSLRSWHAAGIIEHAIHGYSHLVYKDYGSEFSRVPLDVQLEKLRHGKHIVDSVLVASVTIFAPPWNQGDRNTLEACRKSGVSVFSGYFGVDPVEGVTQVNMNCVLFPDDSGIPDAETLYRSLRKGTGIRYLCVFYHSRVDFPDAGAFTRLERLLGELAADSLVEFSSIGRIAEERSLSSRHYAGAGINLYQAGQAIDKAKPYLSVIGVASKLTGGTSGAQEMRQKATEAFWTGDYRVSSEISSSLVGYADVRRGVSRMIVAGVMLAAALFLFRNRSLRTVRRWQAGTAIVMALAIAAVNIFPLFTFHRTHELTLLAALAIGAILLGGQVRASRQASKVAIE